MTTPIVRGSRGRGESLLGLEQAVGGEASTQPLELDEQVALALDPQLEDGEGERRGRRRGAGVVVAAAADDDPHPVDEADPGRLVVAQPHRAGQRAALVSELEVHPGAAGLDAPHLADELDPRELLQANLELGRVPADREGTGEPAVRRLAT